MQAASVESQTDPVLAPGPEGSKTPQKPAANVEAVVASTKGIARFVTLATGLGKGHLHPLDRLDLRREASIDL